MTGLEKLSDITLSGFYDDAAALLRGPAQPSRVSMILRSLRAFGADWYPERQEFYALIKPETTNVGADGLSEITALMEITSEVRVIPAEWWRRAGYRILTALAWPLTLVKGGK